jgi:hypothetical protein
MKRQPSPWRAGLAVSRGFIAAVSAAVSAAAVSLASGGAGLLAAGDDDVNDAIDAGIGYLLAEVEKKQIGAHQHGQVALETYALIVSGVSVEHPLIRKNFELLDKSVPRGNCPQPTYTLSCYIFALDAAIAQLEEEVLMLAPENLRKRFKDDPRIGKQYRGNLKTAVDTLAGLQTKGGGWDYGNPGERYDNSNTQFAVLALGVGAKRSVAIDMSVWLKVMEHFLAGQQKDGPETADRITLMTPSDKEEWNNRVKLVAEKRQEGDEGDKESKKKSGAEGKKGQTTVVVRPENPEIGFEGLKVFRRGWGYSYNRETKTYDGPSWNMTCAGLSSLILARQNLEGRVTAEQKNALNKAIHDGYGWLMGHWSAVASYYGMYSLEKVGDLGEVKLFKDHDWYRELSEHLVGAQRDDGSWGGGGAHGERNEPRVATSFALLVLNRASSLITKNAPGSRIIVSGRSNHQGREANDRSWVYVPSLDTTVHYPSLLRHIRLRPSAKLFEFLEGIVNSYPVERKGELIPELARVRDAVKVKAARQAIDKHLVSITDYEYEDWQDYLKWHRRWERVMLIGSEKRLERVPELLRYYKNTTKSATLKQTIMWALVQCNSREAIPLFLEDLEDSSPEIRQSAYINLKAFFVDFPPAFNARANDAVRREQVAQIRQWCEEQQRKTARS